MKKILFVIFAIGTFLLFRGAANAESFIEGEFINGEYITKDKGNTHLYVTMQYITTKDGDIVYCLEPFVTFKPGSNYNETVWDLSSYSKLSEEQIKRIELLSFYGYGYKNRRDSKWYVITQYLIWKAVDKDATFSFTSTLNGTKINKYESEIAEMEKDIKNRDKLAYKSEFIVDYNDNLNISYLLKSVYDIVDSDYDYVQNNSGYSATAIKESGSIYFSRVPNYYRDKIKLYDSSNNQDLLKPGNIPETVYKIDVVVQKGNFTLNILKTEDVYTIESDFSDTCYEIKGDKITPIVVCTGKDEMTYTSDVLPYGDYEITQISNGVGFVKDTNTYKFTINKENSHPVITVNNFLIKNTIDILKFACRNNICDYEKDAVFSVRDKNGDLVDHITTSLNGSGSLVVGYGLYNIVQEKGLEGYTIASQYTEKIVDASSPHNKVLYNNFIEQIEVPKEPEKVEENEIPEEPTIIDTSNEESKTEEILEPPKTSVDINFGNIFFNILILLWKMLVIA